MVLLVLLRQSRSHFCSPASPRAFLLLLSHAHTDTHTFRPPSSCPIHTLSRFLSHSPPHTRIHPHTHTLTHSLTHLELGSHTQVTDLSTPLRLLMTAQVPNHTHDPATGRYTDVAMCAYLGAGGSTWNIDGMTLALNSSSTSPFSSPSSVTAGGGQRQVVCEASHLTSFSVTSEPAGCDYVARSTLVLDWCARCGGNNSCVDCRCWCEQARECVYASEWVRQCVREERDKERACVISSCTSLHEKYNPNWRAHDPHRTNPNYPS